MYEYILGVVTSYAGGSLVQAEDPIRQEQAVALLSCRLERGGGIPVPMALVPSALGGMICSYSFTSVACKPNLHEGGRPACLVCDCEEVVIGRANHCYTWATNIKECPTTMVLRVSSPVLKCGLRKGGTLGTRFSEPPNTEFYGPSGRGRK
jgi:hypothetical protein